MNLTSAPYVEEILVFYVLPIAIILFGFTFSLLGIKCVLWLLRNIWGGITSPGWPVADGWIIDARSIPRGGRAGSRGEYLFQYKVGAEIYTANKLSHWVWTSRSPGSRVSGDIGTGKSHTVSYNPRNPSIAVLMPGAPIHYQIMHIGITVGMIWVLAKIGIGVWNMLPELVNILLGRSS